MQLETVSVAFFRLVPKTNLIMDELEYDTHIYPNHKILYICNQYLQSLLLKLRKQLILIQKRFINDKN